MLSLSARNYLATMGPGLSQNVVRLHKPLQYLRVTQSFRPYNTSIADRRKDEIMKIFDVGRKDFPVETMRRNYFFAPDFSFVGGKPTISNFEIANLLMDQNIPPEFISLIVAADNPNPERLANLGAFLRQYPKLDQVILVKGSSSRARGLHPSESAYTDLAKIITGNGHKLGTVVNLYQPASSLHEEIDHKKSLGAVSFLSQPIVNPSVLPRENCKIIEDMMQDMSMRVSIGILNVSRNVYNHQRLDSIEGRRTDESGRDLYLMPEWDPRLPAERYNRENIAQTLQWVGAHMKKRPDMDRHRAIYTRVGLGHDDQDASLVLSVLEGTIFDARVRNPFVR